MWKTIAIIVIAIVLGIFIYEGCLPQSYVDQCKYYYNKIDTPSYLQQLRDYCKNNLRNPIDGLNYTELVQWEHNHVYYVPTNETFMRQNMPIDILQGCLGRCGEFAQLYTGLCLANGYQVRLIVDQSTLQNKSKSAAGDHMWCEVMDNGTWVPVEITQSYEGTSGLIVNQPHYYTDVWNKDVNNVVAIWMVNGSIKTEDVTQRYA